MTRSAGTIPPAAPAIHPVQARVAALTAPILVALALAGCTAAPALTVYTLLDEPATGGAALATTDPAPPPGAPVIEVARVSLPDYLDSRDLVVRDGDLLRRSDTGRWATRLSVAATDLITAQLAARRPDAWVTDQPQARPADYRLMIHVSRLDITSGGAGTLEADWEIAPRNASEAVIRRRTRFTMTGSVETDERIARLERALLERLSSEIDSGSLQTVRSKPPIPSADSSGAGSGP